MQRWTRLPRVSLRALRTFSTATLHSADKHIALERQFGAFNYEPLPVVLSRGQGKE